MYAATVLHYPRPCEPAITCRAKPRYGFTEQIRLSARPPGRSRQNRHRPGRTPLRRLDSLISGYLLNHGSNERRTHRRSEPKGLSLMIRDRETRSLPFEGASFSFAFRINFVTVCHAKHIRSESSATHFSVRSSLVGHCIDMAV